MPRARDYWPSSVFAKSDEKKLASMVYLTKTVYYDGRVGTEGYGGPKVRILQSCCVVGTSLWRQLTQRCRISFLPPAAPIVRVACGRGVGYKFNSSPETVVEVVSNLSRNVPYVLLRYFLGHKIHPCLSTTFVSEATMVVSGFGPYHHLVHDDAPIEHAGVILTPWVMPLALGLGAIHLGGDWHLVPSPPCICPISW